MSKFVKIEKKTKSRIIIYAIRRLYTDIISDVESVLIVVECNQRALIDETG